LGDVEPVVAAPKAPVGKTFRRYGHAMARTNPCCCRRICGTGCRRSTRLGWSTIWSSTGRTGRRSTRPTPSRGSRRGVHKSVHAMEKTSVHGSKTWNENPQPFVWTKTADEIFERLNSYL